MPVPTPRKSETQEKFMNRCVSFLMNENMTKPKNDRRPQRQVVAICFNQWKEGHKANSEQGNQDRDFETFLLEFIKAHPELELIEGT